MKSKADSDKEREFRNARALIKRELKSKGAKSFFECAALRRVQLHGLSATPTSARPLSHSYFWTTLISTRNECGRLAFIHIPGSRQ
jgi:hypothetical protein